MKFVCSTSSPTQNYHQGKSPQYFTSHKMLLVKRHKNQYQYISRDYTHLGFGALRRVNSLGLVKLRVKLRFGDAVTL